MNETIIGILRAVFGAFVGAVGFAMLVHVPKRTWLPSGIIAGLSYLLYWALVRAGLSDPVGIFIGSLFGSLAGQVYARRMKLIRTVFLMAAIVPVVPGLGLYRMMAYIGQGRTTDGVDMGIAAMTTIVMIVLGMSAGSFIDRILTVRQQAKARGRKTD